MSKDKEAADHRRELPRKEDAVLLLPEVKLRTILAEGKQEMSEDKEAADHRRKADAVLQDGDIPRMIDFGLGRGVDATNPNPWLNKSSFQVRHVSKETVIGTEEGGALRSSAIKISNAKEQRASLKAGAQAQIPVNISMETELSRSTSSTKWAVMRKVTTRKVCFKTDFEDASNEHEEIDYRNLPNIAGGPPMPVHDSEPSNLNPTDDSPDNLNVASEAAREPGEGDTSLQPGQGDASLPQTSHKASSDKLPLGQVGSVARRELDTLPPPLQACQVGDHASFEARLCLWLLDRMDQAVNDGDAPKARIAKLMEDKKEEEESDIATYCLDYVRHLHITHYISGIELGASEYQVLTKCEYKRHVGTAQGLGAEGIGDLSMRASASLTKTESKLRWNRIGNIGKGGTPVVERGTVNEAVVGVSLQPISCLVKQQDLRKALREAVWRYMDEKELSKYIPW